MTKTVEAQQTIKKTKRDSQFWQELISCIIAQRHA